MFMEREGRHAIYPSRKHWRQVDLGSKGKVRHERYTGSFRPADSEVLRDIQVGMSRSHLDEWTRSWAKRLELEY